MTDMRRRKRKFNIVDVILVILILGIAAALVYVFVSPYTDSIMGASTTTVEYTVLVEGVDDDINYVISEGDTITETNLLSSIGRVISVEYADSEFAGVTSEGESVVGKYPGKKDIMITVRGEAAMVSGSYTVGGFNLAAGKTVNFRVPGFTAEGICIKIAEVEPDE